MLEINTHLMYTDIQCIKGTEWVMAKGMSKDFHLPTSIPTLSFLPLFPIRIPSYPLIYSHVQSKAIQMYIPTDHIWRREGGGGGTHPPSRISANVRRYLFPNIVALTMLYPAIFALLLSPSFSELFSLLCIVYVRWP